STAARGLRSSIENSQMPTKPMVMENKAGDEYGNSADPGGLPSVASHTEGETMVKATEEMRPRNPPMTAPLVVQSFHNTDMNSTGKFAEAAMAKARATMNAIFCLSKAMPSATAITPSAIVVNRDTLSSDALSAFPFLNTVAYRSCETADAPESVRPATTARIVANATAEIKPKKILPPIAFATSTAAMFAEPPPPLI